MLFLHLWLLGLRLRIQGGPAAFLKDVCVQHANCSLVVDSSYDVLMFMTAEAAAKGVRDATAARPRAISGVDPSSLITHKGNLAALASAMRWPFHPDHAGGAPYGDAEATHDDPFSWIAKSAPHRGVRILERLVEVNVGSAEVVQRRVTDPLLIDGTAFDLGVYAILVQPPRAPPYIKVFDGDVLLRFCSAPFISVVQARELARTMAAPALQRALHAAWLVDDDYRSAWDMPSFSPMLLGKGAPLSPRDALKTLIPTRWNTTSWNELWDRLMSIVRRVASVFSATRATGGAATRFELIRCEAS